MDFEMKVQDVYESILKDGCVAIDAGAHVGRHTIPMAKCVYPSGHVYAFEPLVSCCQILKDTLKAECNNGDNLVSLKQIALSDYEGEAEFTVAIDALGYSGLKERTYDCQTRIGKEKVMVNKLDNLFSELNRLDYIKIDAEGGEYDIMKGAINIINKFRPLITFEFGLNSLAEYHVIPEQVYIFLDENQYAIYDILGNPLTDKKAFENSATIQNVWDYVALPRENTALKKQIIDVLSLS